MFAPVSVVVIVVTAIALVQGTHLRIIHTNDIHAHLDEFSNRNGLDCKPQDITTGACVGGIARLRTMVDRIRAADKNTLFLDAGDQFQGTLFYSYFKGKKIAEFMNDIKYDLMCIGNHEFDDGEHELYEFFSNLTFPVVSANIDFTTSLYIKKIVHPYAIIEKNGVKVGVIGSITTATQGSSKGAFNISFLDPVVSVQRAINELHAKGVLKIICLSHSGYKEDIHLAQNTDGLNVIVGGHSHSLLLKNESEPGVVGRYPTEIVNLGNKTTYIVQAHRWGDYLGNIVIKWDCNDNVESVRGDPILLTQEIPKHEPTARKVADWRSEFNEVGKQIVCEALQDFTADCSKFGPCPMADLIADAMLSAREDFGAQLALINSGTIRASFPPGNLTFADFNAVMPFGDILAETIFSGRVVLDMLEAGAVLRNQPERGNRSLNSIPRWSGLKYSFDTSRPAYQRISQVFVRNASTKHFEPLNLTDTYKVVTNVYLLSGGDNIIFPPVQDNEGFSDLLDCVVNYARIHSPISPVNDTRLIVIK